MYTTYVDGSINNFVWWVNVNSTSNTMYITYDVANSSTIFVPPL